MKPKPSAPVSKRAVVQRINRALSKQNEVLKAARGERAKQELGDYFTVDVHHNCVVDKDVNLEQLARELKVIAPFEYMETE